MKPTWSEAHTNTIFEETLNVEISENLWVQITCPKPARLDQAIREITYEGNLDNIHDYCLAYRQGDSGKLVELNTQDKFEIFLKHLNRLKVLLTPL